MNTFADILDDIKRKLELGTDPSGLLDDAMRLLAAVPPDRPDLLALADAVVSPLMMEGGGQDAAKAIAGAQAALRKPTAGPDRAKAGVAIVFGPAPSAAPPTLPAWVDGPLLAEP